MRMTMLTSTRHALLFTTFLAALWVATATAQEARRPASPEGTAATQVDGRWLEITYGRPILRGRTGIFGSGTDYGRKVNDGAPVWRAGANRSTVLRTEVPLEIGGQRVAPGEYVMLVELKSDREWTFILTSQPYQRRYDEKNTTELWGGYNYKPDRDVARAPMRVETIPFSIDQLTWGFTDVTPAGGTMRLWWEKTMASVPFTIGS
jgi:hypothetical protein